MEAPTTTTQAEGREGRRRTFITTAAKVSQGPVDAAGSTGATPGTSYQPLPVAALERVRTLHAQLNSTTSQLQNNVDVVLKKQEAEFLKAFRAHMFSVQEELVRLRAKADEAAARTTRDERLKQLQGERDYFERTALALDEANQRLREERDAATAKSAVVEEERAFLEGKLRASLREAQARKQ